MRSLMIKLSFSRADRLGWASALVWIFLASTAVAQTESSVRTEVPIRTVRLSDGTVRFAIPITLGGHPVLAGLDTGSSGLQVLPRAQHGLTPTEEPTQASYGSGVLLSGNIANGEVAIGALHGTIALNQVRQIGCLPKKPECGASRVSIEHFEILGDGLPDQGFAAVVGTRTQRASAEHTKNPLVLLGVSRWIVLLPQPGGMQEGRLILNPTQQETAHFQTLSAGNATGEVQACLDRPAPALTHVCGSALLDTGAPGLAVLNANVSPEARRGAPAQISFNTEQNAPMVIGIHLNDREQMTRYSVRNTEDDRTPALHPGPLPYLVFAVLYDAAAHSIAFAPRPTYPGGPVLLAAPK